MWLRCGCGGVAGIMVWRGERELCGPVTFGVVEVVSLVLVLLLLIILLQKKKIK